VTELAHAVTELAHTVTELAHAVTELAHTVTELGRPLTERGPVASSATTRVRMAVAIPPRRVASGVLDASHAPGRSGP
jgi:hypothetical protein